MLRVRYVILSDLLLLVLPEVFWVEVAVRMEESSSSSSVLESYLCPIGHN